MARALLVIGLLQFLTLLAGVLRAKGLSIALGLEGVGVVSTIDQIVQTITQLGAIGIPFTALKYMSHAHSESAEAFRRVSNSFVRLLAILAVAITTGSIAAISLWPQIVGAEMNPYITSILTALLSIPPTMATALLVNVLAAAQRSGAAAALAFASVGLQALSAVLGAFFGGMLGLYIATAVSGVFLTFSTLAFVSMNAGVSMLHQGESLRALVHRDSKIPGTALAVYFTMISYAGALLAVRYGVLIESGEAMAGLLHAALTIALTAGSILTAMSGLYLAPALNRATSPEDKVALAHEFAGRILALFMLGAIPVVLFPGLVVSILFTNAFSAGTVFVAGFMTWQCLYQGMNVYQQLLIGLDEIRYMAFSAALGLCAAAAFAVLFIAKAGPGIVSFALVGGAVLTGVLMLVRLRFKYAMPVPVYLVIRTVMILAAIALAHSWFQPLTEFQPAGFAGRAGFAAIAFALLLLQLTPSERAMIGKAYAAARTRFKLAPVRPSQET
jgi:O-antigen/teichoic acid export membrane protein